MAGIFSSQGIWTCGFDFFGTGTSQIVSDGVWDSIGAPSVITCSPIYARYSGKGIATSGATVLQRSLNVNLNRMVIGFAFLTIGLPVSGAVGFVSFRDATAGTDQLGLCYTSTGALQFYKTNPTNNITAPSNPVGTPSAAGTLIPNAYNYIEIDMTIGASNAPVLVSLNGTQVMNWTGNTQSTANAWVSQIYIGSGANGAGGHQFDDLYMLDCTAPAPLNVMLGPVRIQTDGPNADSATAGLNQWAFTTPQGSDFANAANIPPNAAQFNSDGTVGDRMSFRFPNLTSKVFALNMWYSAEEDAAGTRSLAGIYRSNANDQVGASPGNLSASYIYYNQACTIDPNTGQPWTSGPQGAANTCELGLKVNS